MRDHTDFPATLSHLSTCGMSHPAFTAQPQSITAFWPVLIFRPAEGRRLSWPGWLGEILRWFTCLKMVTYPSTSRSGQELNSCPLSRKSSALTTRLSIVSDIAIFVLKRDVKLQPTNWTIEPPPNDDGKISALVAKIYIPTKLCDGAQMAILPAALRAAPAAGI